MAAEVEQRRPYETAMLEMKGRATLDGEGRGFEIAANVADKILSATSIEDVISAAETGPEDLSDLVGTAFNMIGGTLNYAESAEQFRDGGTGFYVIFQCRDARGTDHTVSTGAVNVVFQMKQLERLGVFDNAGELSEQLFTVKSRPTKNGTLYWIGFA